MRIANSSWGGGGGGGLEGGGEKAGRWQTDNPGSQDKRESEKFPYWLVLSFNRLFSPAQWPGKGQ